MRLTRRTLTAGALGASLLPQIAPVAVIRLPRGVRLGIIGFDGHVDEILQMLPVLPDVELTGVADANSDPAHAAGWMTNAYVAKAEHYQKAEELLDKQQLDLAAICNNDGERAGAILACARRKVNVIAEKPLGISRADLDAVYAAAKTYGIHVGMLLPMRFDPPFLALKHIVASGQIGEVLQIDAQKSYQLGKRPEWQKHARTYGSTILWIGIHMIDLMTWISGRTFREVASFQGRAGFPEYHDMEIVTASIFRLDNNGTATLRMDYLRPPTANGHGDDRLRLAGTRGIAEYQESTGVTLMDAETKLHPITNLPPQGSVFVDFLRSTYAGGQPALSWLDIVRANEYTLAAHEAAAEHRLMPIASF
jgi:predicted dehydrogenase